MAKCEVCGKRIRSTRKGVRFCSSTCRSRAHRARVRKAAELERRTIPAQLRPQMEWLHVNLPKAAKEVELVIAEYGSGCSEAVIRACLVAAGEFGLKVKADLM